MANSRHKEAVRGLLRHGSGKKKLIKGVGTLYTGVKPSAYNLTSSALGARIFSTHIKLYFPSSQATPLHPPLFTFSTTASRLFQIFYNWLGDMVCPSSTTSPFAITAPAAAPSNTSRCYTIITCHHCTSTRTLSSPTSPSNNSNNRCRNLSCAHTYCDDCYRSTYERALWTCWACEASNHIKHDECLLCGFKMQRGICEVGWVKIVKRPGREVWSDVERRRRWRELGGTVERREKMGMGFEGK